MADEVTITNEALGLLGVDPITSLDDNIKPAKMAKVLYPVLRDACVESGDWSFAIKLYTLTPDVALPEFGEGQYFTIPSDVLRVITVNDNNYPWTKEGNKVRSTQGTVQMVAISKVLNVDYMSRMFQQVLATRMAMEFALPLTQSKTMKAEMTQMYTFKHEEALSSDGLQGTSKKFGRGRLVGARQNGADLGGRNNVFGPTV